MKLGKTAGLDTLKPNAFNYLLPEFDLLLIKLFNVILS